MKYNIVLIPVDKQNKTELINLANTVILESELPKTNYQINNETSLPHISVFQFELSETDEKKRHEILKKVENITRGVWEKLFQSEKLITIQFEKEINCKYTQQGIFAGTTWVELIIDKSKHPLLQKFHEALINKLKEIDLSSLDYIASSTQRLPIIEKHAKIYESTIATYIPAFLQNISHQSSSENKMANLIGGMKWIIAILDSIKKSNIPISFRLINASVIEKLLKNNFALSYELSKQGEIVLKAESATLMAENKTERIMTIAKKQ